MTWKGESGRHSSASRGIKTTQNKYLTRGWPQEKIVYKLPPITIKDVASVYEGSREGCRCGCLGNYIYPSDYTDEAGKKRGYDISEDEVDDFRLKRIIRKVESLAPKGLEFDTDKNGKIDYYNVQDDNGRVYTIYLR